jgi:hypothetical protein
MESHHLGFYRTALIRMTSRADITVSQRVGAESWNNALSRNETRRGKGCRVSRRRRRPQVRKPLGAIQGRGFEKPA